MKLANMIQLTGSIYYNGSQPLLSRAPQIHNKILWLTFHTKIQNNFINTLCTSILILILSNTG